MNALTKVEHGAVRDWRRHGAAHVISRLRGVEMFEAAKQVSPADPELALRASVSPASTGGWGQQIATTTAATSAFLESLRQRSAAAELLNDALQVDLSGVRAVNLPRTASDFAAPAWIAEGAPIPVAMGTLGFDLLGPIYKLMSIAVLTEELADYSGAAAEQVIGDLMLDSAGRTLDAALFSALAADPAKNPAGLFNGVTALTPADATGSLQDRALADVAAMTAAIAGGGGGNRIKLFAAPAQAMVLSAVSNLDVTPAPGFAAGTVAAIDAGAIAWAGSLPPEIETAKSATLHMDDDPAQISESGSPNTVAAPVRSMFQAGSAALRLRLPITWTVRSDTAVQYVSGVNW